MTPFQFYSFISIDFLNHIAWTGIETGVVSLYMWEYIPSKILTKHVLPTDIETLFTELNFRKCEWLLSKIYHPPSQFDQYFFHILDNALDVYSNYENILLVGDFNAQIVETCLDTFLCQHELKNLNKEPTCYKHAIRTVKTQAAKILSWQIILEVSSKRVRFLLDYQISIN